MRLRYLNPFDEVETSTIECFLASQDNIPDYDFEIKSKVALAPTKPLIKGCFRFDPGRPNAAADFLKNFPCLM